MATRHISPKLSNPVWAAFRRHCHRLLAIGYQEALARILKGPDEETDITGYFCEALEVWFRKNPQLFPGFFIKDDPPLGQSGRTGKHRLRTDIIVSFAAGTRPEFFFEAKRLHRRKAIASRYTGQKGMGCYIDGHYAPLYAEAAMIGYVQTETLEHWQIELQDRVRTEASELGLETSDPAVRFEDSFPLEWASTHRRKGLGKIRIFHVLLDCRKNDGGGETSHAKETPKT